MVDVYLEESFDTLEALGELAHCSIMHRVPLVVIFLCQYLSVPLNDASGIAFKQILHSYVKFLMSLNGVSIVEHSRHELSMFNVHIFETVTLLFSH